MKVWLADKLRDWADWLDPERPPLTIVQERALIEWVAILPTVTSAPQRAPGEEPCHPN